MTQTIFNVWITNTDQKSLQKNKPQNVLGAQEREKKAIRRLASLLSAKWGRHYSKVCGFIQARLAILLAR